MFHLEEIPEKSNSKMEWKTWKQKRRTTMIGFCIVCVVSGVDYGIVFATFYKYLTNHVSSTYPLLLYGFAIAFFTVSSTIYAMVAAYLLDKYGKIRYYVNITLVIQILGNIFYIIPFAPFILFGRFLAGVGDSLPNMLSGEVMKIYGKEGGAAVWKISSAYSIGWTFSPVFSLIFMNVKFQLGFIEVDYTNIAGIVLVVLCSVTLMLANIVIHDCSSEFNLKEYLSKNITDSDENHEFYQIAETERFRKERRIEEIPANNDHECDKFHYENSVSEISCISEEEMSRFLKSSSCNDDHTSEEESGFEEGQLLGPSLSYKNHSKLALATFLTKYPVILLIYVADMFSMYCLFTLDILIPLIVLELFQWSFEALMVLLTVYSIAYTISLFILSNVCTTNRSIFVLSICSMVFQVVGLATTTCIKVLERQSTRDIILIILLLVSFVFMWFIQEIFFITTLAKMVSSDVQNFAESIRFGGSSISCLVAALLSSVTLNYLQYWSVFMAVATSFFIVIFLKFRRNLTDINIIQT